MERAQPADPKPQETPVDAILRSANQNLTAVGTAVSEAGYNLAVRTGLDRWVRVLTRPAPQADTRVKLGTSADQMARAFAAWVSGQDDAAVRAQQGDIANKPTVTVEFTVDGLFGGKFAIVFAYAAGAPLRDVLNSLTQKGYGVADIAGVCQTWPPEVSPVSSDPALFILDARGYAGSEGPAANYVDAWLTEAGYGPLPHKRLIEPRPALPELNSLFIGRNAPIAAIGRAITAPTSSHAPLPVSNPTAGAADSGGATDEPVELSTEPVQTIVTPPSTQSQAWIVSIAGPGGSGKSYVLRRAHELYGTRCVWAQVDHENPEESEEGLLRLMGDIAIRLKDGGCPLPTFDKEFARVRSAIRRGTNANNTGIVNAGRTVQGGAKVASIASELLKAAGHVTKSLNLIGAVAEVGTSIYERISAQRQETIDAILSSRYIQDVNAAICEDLAAFMSKQEKEYILPRRPVIVLDSYELIGPLADQWLRTLFLPRAATFGAVVLIAGRYHLLRFNTRWADYQGAVEYVDLPPFDTDEARTYLTALPGKPDADRADYLVKLTGGLPLFLATAATLPSEEDTIKALAGRVLEEIEAEWRPAALDLSLADGFNLDTVMQIIPDAAKAEKTFNRLSNATFIEGQAGRWRYQPTVQAILSRYRALESPLRTAEVRRLLGQ